MIKTLVQLPYHVAYRKGLELYFPIGTLKITLDASFKINTATNGVEQLIRVAGPQLVHNWFNARHSAPAGPEQRSN